MAWESNYAFVATGNSTETSQFRKEATGFRISGLGKTSVDGFNCYSDNFTETGFESTHEYA